MMYHGTIGVACSFETSCTKYGNIENMGEGRGGGGEK